MICSHPKAIALVQNLSNKYEFDSQVSKMIKVHFTYAIWTRSGSEPPAISLPGVDPRA